MIPQHQDLSPIFHVTECVLFPQIKDSFAFLTRKFNSTIFKRDVFLSAKCCQSKVFELSNPTTRIFLENQFNYFPQLKYFLHQMLAASEHRRSDGAGAKKELDGGGGCWWCLVANCKLNTIQTRSQYAE